MKLLMIVFLIGFLVFGAIGLVLRLNHDWNQLGVESNKLSYNSIARRDGRAMQLIKPKKEFDAKKAAQKAQNSSKRQFFFSIASVVCLVAAIVCGALL